mmetsp:Transcript_73157/g.128906  ORF Transcript_73157/g.128906 Transcript_73157/m.128906 type:complete len:341 (-) Transcript_73157:199-1221(-)
MAAKSVPFVASTALGEQLLASVQKVLTAAKVPVTLVKTDAKAIAGSASHILAEPLSTADVGELANKYGLTSKVTSAKASGWYPNTIYPKLAMEAVQNLYAASNPSFASASAAPTKAVATRDDSALKLLELEKEAERAITGFFSQEAKASLLSTLKLAVDSAISGGTDKSNVCVISKPAGDGMTSPFDDLLAGVVKAETDARADELRASSVSVEVSPVGQAWPKLVMFPENTQMVVCPPTASGDQVASLVAGMGGGSGMVSQKCVGGSATVYTCANKSDVENPTGILIATCELLTEMGYKAEATKIMAALEKTYKAKVLPKELPGGSASGDAFISEVVKNC